MRFLQHRVALLSACLPLAIAITACNQPAPPPATAAPPAAAAAPASTLTPVERGQMLVYGGGCHDCHTPKKFGPGGPEPDMSLSLSGHPEKIEIKAPYKPAAGSPWTIATNDTLTAWSGAWGVSFAANLTPDKETGLSMNERNFVTALKTGAHLGTARPILPPMPWHWYGQLPDEDLKAMWAYLQTIPAIKNHVPAPIPPAGAKVGPVAARRDVIASFPHWRRGRRHLRRRAGRPARSRRGHPAAAGPRSRSRPRHRRAVATRAREGAARHGRPVQGRLRLPVRRPSQGERHHLRSPHRRRRGQALQGGPLRSRQRHRRGGRRRRRAVRHLLRQPGRRQRALEEPRRRQVPEHHARSGRRAGRPDRRDGVVRRHRQRRRPGSLRHDGARRQRAVRERRTRALQGHLESRRRRLRRPLVGRGVLRLRQRRPARPLSSATSARYTNERRAPTARTSGWRTRSTGTCIPDRARPRSSTRTWAATGSRTSPRRSGWATPAGAATRASPT